ncbi:MAG: response regulator [Myxococcota bacterium]
MQTPTSPSRQVSVSSSSSSSTSKSIGSGSSGDPATSDSASFRVLLIEDDPADAHLVRRFLSRSHLQFEVAHSETLQDGLAKLRTLEPDVVLVDLGLPDATGLEALERVRAAKELPVVVLTGLDDVAVGLEAAKSGAQDFLVKGEITEASLPRAIRLAIERVKGAELRRKLAHSDRLASIGQLAAGVAHEINNPVMFLLHNLQASGVLIRAIQREWDDLAARFPGGDAPLEKALAESEVTAHLRELVEMLDDNLSGAERIQSIARDLGSFSRVDNDTVEWVDLNEMVQSACNLAANEMRHRARLVQHLRRLPKVPAHRGRLSQVAVNLIINAVHAIPDDDPANHCISVETKFDPQRAEVSFLVTDTGVGIPREHQAKVFEPFFTTKERDRGTGLGLSLCFEIVSAHRGRVELESEVGAGTTFQVILPLETGLAPQSRDSEPSSNGEQIRGRLVFIDDDDPVRRALVRLLKPHHEVVAFGRASEAVTYLASHGADVILCDLMMPEVDGSEFYATLKRVRPSLLDALIFVSGGAVTERIRTFVDREEVVVLDKPIPKADLLAAIQKRIRKETQ